MDFCNLPCENNIRDCDIDTHIHSHNHSCDYLPLAAPYVRPQRWETPMEPACALCAGTVFPSLSMPLSGYCADCDNNCLDKKGRAL